MKVPKLSPLIILFLRFALSNMCDELIPFSGFKLAHEYKIQASPLSAQHFMQIAQCTNGKAVSTARVPLGHLANAIRDTFCMVLGSVLKESLSIFQKVKALFKGDINSKAAAASADDIACFKVARRKSLAMADSSYFVPHTFVGALFQCNLTQAQKQAYLSQQSEKIACNHTTLAKPLVADDFSKGTVSWSVSKGLVTQKFPYLKTALSYDPRFALELSWTKDIKVNEDYSYTKREMKSFSSARSRIRRYVHKLARPPALVFGKKFKEASKILENISFSHFLSLLNATSKERHLKAIKSFWPKHGP